MHKDTVTTPMEPFTRDEEAVLFEKLDRLSVPELESYIGSARTSLGNRALDPTWRPRIEIALKRAEIVHLREEAAAAVLAAAPPVLAPPPAKAKRASKASKADEAGKADEASKADKASKADEAGKADDSGKADESDEAE